jgi:hypothetical protein
LIVSWIWVGKIKILDHQDQDQEPLPAQLQEDGGTIGQLKQYLMNRKDCPDGAFVVVIYE